jgi:tetratricopeptide (TPR) repeat protein
LNKTSPLKKLIFALFLINSLCLYTQTKSFVREYTYKAGEADSKLSSKTLALKEVKTLLLEEIGVYLSSEFENKIEQKQVNGKTEFNQLTKSNIITLAAGITKTTILDEKWNGETYYLKAEIIVDIDDTKRKLKELVNDKAKTKELEDIQAKNKEANDEIDKLKKELETAKAKNIELTEKDKTRIQENYNAKINILDANEWFQKGLDAQEAKEYENAIIYYNKAIELNPDDTDAYYNRGNAKKNLQDYTGAITDYNQAIQLNPDFAGAYNNRGTAKYFLKDKNGACLDWSKAGELGDSEAYTNIQNFCQ